MKTKIILLSSAFLYITFVFLDGFSYGGFNNHENSVDEIAGSGGPCIQHMEYCNGSQPMRLSCNTDSGPTACSYYYCKDC